MIVNCVLDENWRDALMGSNPGKAPLCSAVVLFAEVEKVTEDSWQNMQIF